MLCIMVAFEMVGCRRVSVCAGADQDQHGDGLARGASPQHDPGEQERSRQGGGQ